MRALVTGGAGFIGSHVVDQLVHAGVEVRVLDCLLPDAHDSEPGYLNPAADYRWADVADPAQAMAATEGVDAVCHQAARVGLGVGFGDVTRYVDNNDRGTAALLEALHRRSFRGRFILASSMVVYGEGAYRCPTHGQTRPGPRLVRDLEAGRFEPPCPLCGSDLEPFDLSEDAPADPRNVYAATKLHQEHLCGIFAHESGAAVCALRYHNVYGPRMPRDTPYAGVASIFRSMLELGRAPVVLEDGRQRRDFVHVSDVARANVTALLGEPAAVGAFNVASGKAHTVGGMAAALRAAFGPGAPEPVVTGGYRLGDVRHVTASPARAEAVLGFRARVAFAEGMAEFARAELRGSSDARLATEPGAGR